MDRTCCWCCSEHKTKLICSFRPEENISSSPFLHVHDRCLWCLSTMPASNQTGNAIKVLLISYCILSAKQSLCPDSGWGHVGEWGRGAAFSRRAVIRCCDHLLWVRPILLAVTKHGRDAPWIINAKLGSITMNPKGLKLRYNWGGWLHHWIHKLQPHMPLTNRSNNLVAWKKSVYFSD